jgi:peptide/nickel transport system substrate-binding protein
MIHIKKDRRGIMKRLLVILGLVIIAALLVSCGTTPSTTSSATTSSEQPAYGGTLKIGYSVDADNIGYPPTMTRSDALKFAYTAIEGLIRVDTNGNIIPWLAASWEIDASANTITFTLQQGVKFHDGTDFDASAVKWNLEQCIAAERPELSSVSSIDVVDNHTVRINLSKWDATLLTQLATSSAGLMISPTAFQNSASNDTDRANWCITHPIGTGPFKFVSWQRDVEQVYTKFDGYWQAGKPYLDEVDWIIIADPTTELAAFKAGETDVILEVDAKDAKDLAQTGLYIVSSGGGQALYSLVSDSANSSSPFSDIRVRRAVEYAIDKETICSTLGQGAWAPIYQAAPPGNWAENTAVTGYHYDPTKAEELLAEIGYSVDNPLKTTLYSLATPTYFADQATAIQGYLQAVGIDAEIQLLDQGGFFNVFFTPGWQDGLVLAPTGLRPDTLGMLNWIFGTTDQPSSILAPLARPADVQDLIAKAMATTDFATEQDYVQQIQELIVDKYCSLSWLFQINISMAKSKKVHDDGLLMFPSETSWRPENAWIEQ